jgi:hypothetical protein
MLPEKSFCLPGNKVASIAFDKNSTTEAVTVFLTKPFDPQPFVLHSPERIVIDIADAFVPGVRINKNTDADIVTSVTVAQNRKDTVRVVLHIAQNLLYHYRITQTADQSKPGFKITVFHPPQKKTTKSDADQILEKARANVFSDDLTHKKTVPPPPKKKPYDPDESVFLFEDTSGADIFEKTGAGKKRGGLTLSGIVQIRASMDTKNNDHIENKTHLKNRILLESRYKKTARVSVLSDYLYFGNDNKTDEYNLDLHEAVFSHNNHFIDFSMGKQIIRWGKADLISPVDTINPTDAREFILADYEETKQPVWMADLKLLFDTFTLEGVFVPVFEKAELDYFGTDWAVFTHLKKEIAASPVPENIKHYFNRLAVDEQDPNTEAEFGLRLTTTVQNWDLGVSWHHTTEDMPYFTSFPVKNIHVGGSLNRENLNTALETAEFTDEKIMVEFQRTNIIGCEFETTLSGFGIRGEAAWYENQSLLTASLTSSKNTTFTYTLGADYTTKSDIYLNLQFTHQFISGYTPDILYFKRNNYSLSGEISRDIFMDWLEASVLYSITLSDNAWYLSPRITHTYVTNLDLVIGADIFSGDGDTWLGRFSDNDQLFIDISYRF